MIQVYPLICAVSIFAIGVSVVARADEVKPKKTVPNGSGGIYQILTGEDGEDVRRQWDALFSKGGYVFGREPARFLKDNIHRLPVGRALDIAMGEGRNAVYLAKKGFVVEGVDFSEVAIRKAKRLAKENRVSLTTINADLDTYAIRPESYDVIVNVDFLLRSLVPGIKRGIKRGGYLVFENHTVDQLKNPGNTLKKDFMLAKGELRELFKDFQVLVYQETNDGKDARASLVARKP